VKKTRGVREAKEEIPQRNGRNKMKGMIIITLWLHLLFHSAGPNASAIKEKSKESILFVSYFGYEEQLVDCLTLCESIRKFAGSFDNVPIIIYFHESLQELKTKYQEAFSTLNAELKSFKAPKEAFQYDLGTKPFIAALVEQDALGKAALLAYLDPNIIILNHLKHEELELLPFAYNYPLFFDQFYESELKFDSLNDVITLKCEIFKSRLPANWDKQLKGSPEVISWINDHLSK